MNEYKKAAIFSGSRDWIDRQKVAKVFDQLRPDVVIEGGADGLDTIARWECLERKISVITFHADWNKFKLSAGPIRNKQMLTELLKFKKKGYEISVQAFPIPGGKGTQGMMRMAELYGVPVRVHKPISTQHLMGKRSARK
jgi:YspA, cpYpsA-related SLOG family